MTDFSLHAENLSVKLGNRSVLDPLSFRLAPGSIIGLIGPNGAGKSTLLRSLSGLETYSGRVTIGDRDLSTLTVRERSRLITYVGAEVATAFPLTAIEAVALGGYALGMRKNSASELERVRLIMEETGCAEYAERPLIDLSSGERQRVHLARALLQGSKWICLDESFSRLDLHHQARIGALLKRYLARGFSFVFVSHDLNFTTDWADRCVLLKDGKIIAEGATDAVVNEATLRQLYPDAEIILSPHPVTGSLKVYFRG